MLPILSMVLIYLVAIWMSDYKNRKTMNREIRWMRSQVKDSKNDWLVD